ncbi:ATP-binding protein [Streptomyces coeruleorubidus]|uniref:ATP-binding protein n=1 Tax=Streptomyces coeruleorubidus TaxID=116188 RepID=UPI0037B39462
MELIERERELAELSSVLREAERGSGGAVVIGGAVGCGKTELMGAVAGSAADAGWLVLTAVSSWAERHSAGSALGQLLRYADIDGEDGRPAASLLESLGDELSRPAGGAAADFDQQTLDAATTAALHQLCTAVLRRSAEAPVLLCVDDIHHTDVLSLHWLVHLLHRSRGSRIVVLMTECLLYKPAHPRLHTELLRHPNYRRMTLDRLSPQGVEAVLAELLDSSAAERLAARCHAVSGGNPLLVRALAEDCRNAVACAETDAGLPVGDAYSDTVLSCLDGGRPILLRLAQVLAVLDDPTDVAGRAARILGEKRARVDRALHALESAGLTREGRLRHPAARQAVSGSLSPRRHAELHRRSAELLYEEGAPVTQVARHVIAADGPLSSWTVSLLREAAERYLAAHRAAEAHQCVVAALRRCEDETERVTLKALLASTAWALNPSISARHLGDLASALRDGRLPEQHALMLAKYLLWHGRFDEAAMAFERISERERHGPREAAEIRATRELLASTYPALVRRAPAEVRSGAWSADRSGPDRDPRVRGAAALSYVLAHGPHDGAVADAEAAMRTMRLTKHTQEWLTCAVSALFFADRLEAAGTWCDYWLREAKDRNVPLWAAEFASLRASVSLRQGEPVRARQLAESALARVPAESWGVCLGGPLAHLVRAGTDTGDLASAAEYLDVPVPEGMFESRFGLYYLHARGRYQLQSGKPDGALGDFLACGELMRRWGFDQPTLVPWRSEAAYAHLALGHGKRALALAREQLALAGKRPTWARAVSLRAVAAAGPPDERPALLTEAVQTLERVGDRLQRAEALADLGCAYGKLRRPTSMRPALDTAARLAEEIGARPLARRIREAGGMAVGRGKRPADLSEALARLSGAERRVAGLAALGCSNREIAEKLGITRSTVEQHLTRVFKKLGVRARKELPAQSVI